MKTEFLNINDVLLARIFNRQRLRIHLITSNSGYNTIAGNSHFFKCRDLYGFRYGTFGYATNTCKKHGLIDDLFEDFPKLNESARHQRSWLISEFELKKCTNEFLERQNQVETEIWSGYRRINSSYFGLGNHFVRLDAFDPKFGFSRFGMVPNNLHFLVT